ncbi:SPARC-like [Mytilus californianus]|uniref:SPARC-like n=1 Tax=Mytilus californianus TaxID=6549 RepID=UPI00224720CA|nr:SPARC-like [Mytilus californianus]
MWRPFLLFLLVTFVTAQVHIKVAAPENFDDDDDEETDSVPQPVVPQQARSERTNPCNLKRCGRGEECILDENINAKCVCIRDCADELDDRFKVCSVRNETFASECHLDRAKCLCKNGDHECKHSSPKKLRLDYYGACKEMTSCEDWELQQFPGRMRDWTFVVMKEMARRNELGDYLELLKTANADDHHTDAVIWKFCNLDVRPQDRHVSRRELLMVIATIKPLEHCLVPFLNKCDDNSDHTITLDEWGTCLELDQGHLADKCEAIHNRAKRT